MLRNAKSISRFALLATALAVSGTSALPAQTLPPKAWTTTLAFTGLRVGASGSWALGPELGIRRDFGPHWGVGIRASLPIYDPKPFSDDGAAALDLGPTLSFKGDRSELGFSVGATAFLVGDSSDFIDGGIGAFADAHATAWLTPWLGVVAGATVRMAGEGGAYPSLSAGLSARF